MRLNKLVLTKVSGIPKQVRRPMTFRLPADADTINLEALPDSLNEDDIMDVSLGMNPNTIPLAISNVFESVDLPCGDWSDERFMFKAELCIIKCGSYSDSVMTAIVSGFTDTANVLNGTIDPSMEFYVNHVRVSRDIEFIDGNRLSLLEDKIIARGNIEPDSKIDMLIRPSDALFHTATLNEGFELEESQVYVDTRSTFHTGIKLVDTSDLVASTYCLRTLYATRKETDERELYGILSGFKPHSLESAAIHVKESTFSQTDLGGAISKANGIIDFNKTGVMTFSELAGTVTNAWNIKSLTDIYSFDQLDGCESNADTCVESHIAYVLSQDLTYVASVYNLDVINFTATNATGETVLSIHNDFETDVVDKSELGESDRNTVCMNDAKILAKLHATLVSVFNNSASNNNGQLVTVEVNADPHGLIVIGISLDNRPVKQYCYAGFASGMLSPVITNNHAVREELAELVNYLANIHEHAYGWHTPRNTHL